MILVRRLALLLTAFTAPTYATCYNPNGSVAADDIPCQPSQSNSTCCGSGLACLSNNLCGITQFPSNPKKTFGLGEWFVRGSCTDKTFTSSACFKRCLRSATGDLYSLFTPVRQCLAGSRDRWYCSNAQTRDQSLDEVCFALNSTDEFVFQMDANPTTVAIIHTAPSGGGTAITSPTGEPASRTTPVATPATTSSTTLNTPFISIPSAGPKPDYSIPIGIGVGLPLGITAFGVLLFLYLRYRRETAIKQKLMEEKMGQYVQTSVYAYHAELSDRSRAGELPSTADPHELSAEKNRPEGTTRLG